MESPATLEEDVRAGLSSTPKSLPPKYLFDPLGSVLFRAITLMPWYRVYSAEKRLLRRVAGGPLKASWKSLIEIGSGDASKLALFATSLKWSDSEIELHAVDLSEEALERAEEFLGQVPGSTASVHRADFLEWLEYGFKPLPRPAMLLLLGSTIGNLEPFEARSLLSRISESMVKGDALLLGADLVKSREELLLAYDDPLSITAAFDKNILVRLNRSVGARFDLAAFRHLAVWNEEESRIEMHLVSLREQVVQIDTLELEVPFAEGESIVTEHSYKFSRGQVRKMVEECGLATVQQWVDEKDRYSLTLFEKSAI